MRDGTGWKVDGAQRFDIRAGALTPLAPLRIADGVRPDQFTLSYINADGLSFTELSAGDPRSRARGTPDQGARRLAVAQISGPLSSVLMPLLGAVAAFGLARSGKLFVRAVIGMALGFLYFVADNFALAMGNLGAYPPFLAAWAPFILVPDDRRSGVAPDRGIGPWPKRTVSPAWTRTASNSKRNMPPN